MCVCVFLDYTFILYICILVWAHDKQSHPFPATACSAVPTARWSGIAMWMPPATLPPFTSTWKKRESARRTWRGRTVQRLRGHRPPTIIAHHVFPLCNGREWRRQLIVIKTKDWIVIRLSIIQSRRHFRIWFVRIFFLKIYFFFHWSKSFIVLVFPQTIWFLKAF